MDYSQGAIGGAMPQQPQPMHPGAPGAHNEFTSKERPPFPTWVAYLLIPILLLTIIVIGLAAFSVNYFTESNYDTIFAVDSLGFSLFAGAWGLIVTTYIFLAIGHFPNIHYKWLVFVLAIFSCLWWLVAFAWLASQAKDVLKYIDLAGSYVDSYGSSGSSSYGSYGDYSDLIDSIINSYLGKRDLSKRASALDEYNKFKSAARCMAAGAGIGALVWVLWIVFTVFYSIGLFRTAKFGSGGMVNPGAPVISYEPKSSIPLEQPYYPAAPVPVASPVSAYGPTKPDPSYDPRVQTPFITPPPPQQYQPMPIAPAAPVAFNEMPAQR